MKIINSNYIGKICFRAALYVFAVFVTVTLMTVGPVASQSLQSPGHWNTMKPIPQGANEVIGTAVDEKVIVYGGQLSPNIPQGLFWMYQPDADSWIKLPTNPVPVHHAALVGIGRRLYLMGGFKLPVQGPSWVPVDNVWMFDLDTGQWKALAPMPTARGALSAVAVGNKIYAIGGASIPSWSNQSGLLPQWPTEQSAANEVYDTLTNSWSKASPMLTARNHLGAGFINGKIYVVGGRVGSHSSTQSANITANEAYDVATNVWEPKTLLPTARSGIGVVVLNGRLHVIGGEGYVGDFGGTFRTHEAYEPSSNTWQRLAPMPTPRHGFAAAVAGSRIYVVSGRNVPGGGGPAVDLTANEVFLP